MKTFLLRVNKIGVYDEVAKATSYVAAKKIDADSGAYDRIFTTDEDRLLLERFWVETCNDVTGMFKPFIISVVEQPISHGVDLARDYILQLSLSESFEDSLMGGIETGVFSFFVVSILAKWFRISNKDEAEIYFKEAASIIMEVNSKLYFRKKPVRKIG